MNASLRSSLLAALLALTGATTMSGLAGCAATPTRDSTGEYVDDATVTAKVKAALLGDSMVKSFEIGVQTVKGVVQLSGFVDNADQKMAAMKDARGVAGVQDVRNDLIVKS
jgi:hyperosmotically inducible protein